MNDDDLLSCAQAAAILNISRDGVKYLADRGRLPIALRSVQGMRLFRRNDVEQLAAKRAALADERRTHVA